MNATSVTITILALLASTFRFFVFVIFHRIRLLNFSGLDEKSLLDKGKETTGAPFGDILHMRLGYI